LASERLNQDVTVEEVKVFLAERIVRLLEPVVQPLHISPSNRPHVVLVVGVNGSGKTTTLGKLAKYWLEQGLKVQLVAGDTFRAAAVEQLRIWGQRLGVPVHSGPADCDAAGLAYDALVNAKKEGVDVLAIDTAGRLHNKTDLMAELEKIRRVLAKLDPTAPHTTLLVLDATIGQNAHVQVQTFQDLVKVSGLVLTKLDGTAKGGVVVALAEKTKLPIHAIGVGESAEDLRPFTAKDFAYNLLGIQDAGE
jgi:fused signal recognition particle receptor